MAASTIVRRNLGRVVSFHVMRKTASTPRPSYLRCLAKATTVSSTGRRLYSSDSVKNEAEDRMNPQVSETREERRIEEEEEEYEHGIKQRVLAASLNHVIEMGWSKEALQAGARDEGLSEASQGMFPKGEAEIISHFYKKCNTELVDHMKKEVERLTADGPEKLKTRPFLQSAIETRLKMIIPYQSTWKQAMAIQTLPQNAMDSWENLVNLCDDIWYYAGDRSTDFDWYTKRYSLAACYKATEIYMLQDSSPDFGDTWVFLDNRLTNLESMGDARRSMGPMADGLKSLFEIGRNVLGMNSRKR